MAVTESIRSASRALADMTPIERVCLQFEVEQFLFEEAALIDARDYVAWLGLVTQDIHYWMPIRRTVTRSDMDMEFTKPGEIAFFDDDRDVLEMRVKKLEASSAWAEDPPSRSRHLITNVRVLSVAGSEVAVESSFHLYRSRLNTEVDNWVGRRSDVLRRVEGTLRLAKRHIFLDQTLIRATNMSTLF